MKAKVTVVSLDDKKRCPKGAQFIKSDLRIFQNCLKVTKNKEIVFHLAGIKGSPKMAYCPASFLYPTISFSFNMLEAARINKVKNYLFTSSVESMNLQKFSMRKKYGLLFHQKMIGMQGSQREYANYKLRHIKKSMVLET